MNNKSKSALAIRYFKKLHEYMGSNAEINEKFSHMGEDDPRALAWRAAQHKVYEYWNAYIAEAVLDLKPKKKARAK